MSPSIVYITRNENTSPVPPRGIPCRGGVFLMESDYYS